MAQATPLINNFNGGELSPELDARSDINKYFSGCLTLQNSIPLVEGGTRKVPGTYFADYGITSGGVYTKSRLVPFHFSTTQSYCLEFGPLETRFFEGEGKVVVDTSMVDWDPSKAYFVGEFTKVGTYNSLAWATWKILYICSPYGQSASSLSFVGTTGGVDTLSVTKSGTQVTIALANSTGAKNSAKLIQDAIRGLTPIQGIDTSAWTVTENAEYNAARPITGNAVVAEVVINGLYQNIYATAASTVNCNSFPPVNASVYTARSLGSTLAIVTTYTEDELFDLKFCQSADVLYIFHPSHAPAKLVRTSHIQWELSNLATISVNSAVIGGITRGSPTYIATVTNHGLQVGDMVYIAGVVGTTELNGNTYEVEGIYSDTTIGIICDSTSYGAWGSAGTVQKRYFYATDKYPSCATFFEQRLAVGGSNYRPTTVEMSVVCDYEDFSCDPDKNDFGVEYTLVSGKVDRIRWLVGQDFLIVGTPGGVWKLGATSANDPITQVDVSAKKQTPLGVGDIEPIDVNDGVLFTPRSNMGLYKLAYSWETDRWMPADMARLAKHITKGTTLATSGIKQMAFQCDPVPILWAVRNDGQLLGMTYEAAEEVYAWFRVVMDGTVESVAVVSLDGEEDRIWVVVSRTISGATVRHIEFFKAHEFYDEIKDAFFVHSGLSRIPTPPIAITGITKANPAVVTAASHGFVNGDLVRIRGVAGMTEINNANPPTGYYTVAGVTAGAEIVTNGAFTSDISSWTDLSTGTGYIYYISSKMGLYGAFSSISKAQQAVTTEAGHVYRVSYRVETSGHGTVIADVGASSGAEDLYAGTGKTTGSYSFIFTATGTTSYIQFSYSYPTSSGYVDTVSCVEISSYNSFQLSGLNSSNYTAYGSGGYVEKVVNSVTGLTHLEGKTVTALVDGYVATPTAVVTSGAITLNYYGNKIHAGLPYDTIIQPTKLHAGSQLGTARGKHQKINNVTCCFYETGNGVKVGPDSSSLLNVQGLTDAALTTDDIDFQFPGDWKDEGTLYIKHSDPLPMTILALVPHMTLNED